MIFQQVTIIGMGLIGSSIARSVRRNNVVGRIVAVDADKEVCKIVNELELADEVTSNIRRSVLGSDLVIIAVPVGAYSAVAGEIGPALRPGAIVSDVGSVKMAIATAVQK